MSKRSYVQLKGRLLDEAAVAALAETFKVLGDATRVRILDALARAEVPVCDLAMRLGAAHPQASGVSPIVAQGRAILGAVASKEALVSQWRPLSQKAHATDATPELKEQLAALTTKVEEADARIRDAARPQKLHFELVPVQE